MAFKDKLSKFFGFSKKDDTEEIKNEIISEEINEVVVANSVEEDTKYNNKETWIVILIILLNKEHLCFCLIIAPVHDIFTNTRYFHRANLLHFLLCGKQNTKSCTGDVLHTLYIENKVFGICDILIDGFIKRGGCDSIESSYDFDNCFFLVFLDFNSHTLKSPLYLFSHSQNIFSLFIGVAD